MAAFPLPLGLEEKLDDLAAEVRKLRVLRGLSWFGAFAFTVPVLAIVADSLLNLPGWLRTGLLAMWAIGGVVGFWLLVIRRWRGSIPPAELAAAVEREYPNLAERLKTLVELSESAGPGNGSKALIAMLAAETDRRSRKIDFSRAAPTGFSLRLAGLATIVGLMAIVPLFFVTGAAERVRKFLVPWYQPPVDPPYRLKVSSGAVVVSKGDPVTLSGYLERTRPGEELPTTMTLSYRSPGSPEVHRLPMTGDEKAAFAVTRPKVESDFEYRLEAGELQSDWYSVSAVDLPSVVETESRIRAVPPMYSKRPDGDFPWGPVKVLADSTVEFQLRLSREPSDVQCEWRPVDGNAKSLNALLKMEEGGKKVSLRLPIETTGTIKFTAFAEKGLRNEIPLAIEAEPDLPPKFESVVGLPSERRQVQPNGELKLQLAVMDDFEISELHFDFAPLSAPLDQFQSESIPLKLHSPKVEGAVVIALTGKAKLGVPMRVRLRAKDNRAIPEFNKTPQETIYPPDGWATFDVVESARPLAEQEIVAERDAGEKALDAIIKLVRTANERTENLKRQTKGKTQLTPPQAADLTAARAEIAKAQRGLNELANREERTPLARAARELAEGQLAKAEDELRKANTEPNPMNREEGLVQVQKQLDSALERLDRLKSQNEKNASAQLDRAKLDELADEQSKLADAAGKAKPEEQAELEAKQRALKDQLAKLRSESPSLTEAEKEARRQQAEDFAKELKDLADKQRELDDAIAKSEKEAKREKLDELSKRQKELNDKVAKLGSKTDRAAVLGEPKPLDLDPFAKAQELLEKEKPSEALTQQERGAKDLDRLADELAKKATERGDARKAAEQLKRWQDELVKRSEDKSADQEKLKVEQKAIAKAIPRLDLPKTDALEKLRRDAAEKSSKADDPVSMKEASEALAKLAEAIPSNTARCETAKKELEKLKREQEQIQKESTDAAATMRESNPDDVATRDELAKKLSSAANKQDELRRKLESLDTPGSEARRDRAGTATQRAAEDLRAGLPQDIPASQDETLRQMNRLKESLEGQTPADEKAEELARLQRDLTRNLSKVEKPDELQRLQRQQEEIAKQLNKMQAPEAPGALADAQEAARQAERAGVKPQPKVDELEKKSKAAEEALDKLAGQLNRETPVQRLERLAENRKAEAESARAADKARPDMTRSRESQKQAERDLVELRDTRTGENQALKKKLLDDLDAVAKHSEPDRAPELQKQAAESAKKLAEAVKKSGDRASVDPLPKAPNRDPADATDPGNVLPTEVEAKQARELAKDLRELEQDVARAAVRAAQPMPDPKAAQPKPEQKQQADLKAKAEELAGKMERAAMEKEPSTPESQQLERGAEAAKRAAEQMEKAERQQANGKAPEAAEARRQAEKILDDGARAAKGNNGAPDAKPQPRGNEKATTDAAKGAEGSMEKAGEAMKNGKPGEASQAGKKAAEQLKAAAKELGKGSGKGQGDGEPNPDSQGTGGKPGFGGGGTTGDLPKLLIENLGKPWGELPGDVKAQLTQELKAKYGEDYARIIKLYFEQLAEKK